MNRKKSDRTWRITTSQQTLFFLLRSLRSGSDGYAMIMTSIMAILVFSLLSVYLFSTKFYQSSSASIVDGGSTFYAAEAGLNQRAAKAHKKFEGYAQPTGTTPAGTTVLEQMNNCITGAITDQGSGDYACSNKSYDYYEPSTDGRILSSVNKIDKNAGKSRYTAYSFIRPNVDNPSQKRIPAGETWAGLNSLEYNYRIYATALRQNDEGTIPVAAQTLLQMDFYSRLIPLFQFAAFYENDLEINPSPNMSINGPVHTNSKLFIAPGGDLTLQGNITSVMNMYNSMSFVSTYLQTTSRILLSNGNFISAAIAWSQANHQIDPADIDGSGGQLKPNVDRLSIPEPGFLSKVNSTTGSVGEYYDKADLRVEFTPQTQLRDVPFSVTTIKGGGGSAAASLSTDQLRSLRQPVLAMANSPTENAALCSGVSVGAANLGLSTADQARVERAIYAAILAQPEPVAYSLLNQPLAVGSPLYNSLNNYLSISNKAAVLAAAPQAVVKDGNHCFLPAPFQVVRVNDRREGRNIQVLQTNIRSLTVWNKDGKYVRFDTAGNVTDVNTSNPAGLGFDISDALFNSAAANTSAPAGSYQNLGRSGADRSEGGFVWHFNIDKAVYPSPTTPYPAKQSIYGFGFADAQDLPNALTLVTDQAIYLQGDYNTIDKKPSATMGDTIAVLSNACSNADRQISCGDLLDAAGNPTADQSLGVSLPVATPTTINAAFLSRTDTTDITLTPIRFSGGLNNYIRMLENWGNVELTYRGSFISLGVPQEFSGSFLPGRTPAANLSNIADPITYSYFFPPIRNFSFDTSFNNAVGLPPMTPKVVSLSQKVFKQNFDGHR